MLYDVKWSKFEGHTDYQGYTVIEADTEEQAEEKFFMTREKMNPYKGNYTGYCIEYIDIYSRQ